MTRNDEKDDEAIDYEESSAKDEAHGHRDEGAREEDALTNEAGPGHTEDRQEASVIVDFVRACLLAQVLVSAPSRHFASRKGTGNRERRNPASPGAPRPRSVGRRVRDRERRGRPVHPHPIADRPRLWCRERRFSNMKNGVNVTKKSTQKEGCTS